MKVQVSITVDPDDGLDAEDLGKLAAAIEDVGTFATNLADDVDFSASVYTVHESEEKA